MSKGKLALLLGITAAVLTAVKRPDLSAILPTGALAGKQANDGYLVATAQLVRPWRLKSEIKGRPVDFAIDSTGSIAAVLNGNSVVTIDLASGREVSRIATKTSSYLGIRFRPGAREIWASEATRTGALPSTAVQRQELAAWDMQVVAHMSRLDELTAETIASLPV